METISNKNTSGVRFRIARWRETFFAQKYRFDLGQSFLVVINFTLLIITASDKLQIFFGIPRLRSLLIVIVPVGFIGVWLFGYFMDKVVRAAQMSERQSVRRSEVWTRHNEQMDRIEKEMLAIRTLLEKQQTP
jgi:hypothetical protein